MIHDVFCEMAPYAWLCVQIMTYNDLNITVNSILYTQWPCTYYSECENWPIFTI